MYRMYRRGRGAYDHTLMHVGGKGNWTTDGCVTYVHQSNLTATIECHCFHLTNFAILVVRLCYSCSE